MPDGLPLAREDKQKEESTIQIHTSILLPSCARLFCLLFSHASCFLLNLQPPSTAMATELPSLWFRTMGSLASLRWLMVWQAPGLEPRLKRGIMSLANMEPGEFIFFSTYALARLVPPLSPFFLTLLEYYGLQLQHLLPNSITLVVIFVHFYEMFVGVRPSVWLFWHFFVMKAARLHPPLIDGYYFQCWMQNLSRYIAPVSLGRWERWRDDWALVQADAHDRHVLPAAALTLDRIEWGKDPDLELGFHPMLDQIRYLAENGLTSLMVLHNFLSKHLAPLQDHPRPMRMYTGVNDIMQLDHGLGSSLDENLLAACLKALTSDQFLAELMAPPVAYEPICMNQATRMVLLVTMPMLDDIDITTV
jgi:hypothetical protein